MNSHRMLPLLEEERGRLRSRRRPLWPIALLLLVGAAPAYATDETSIPLEVLPSSDVQEIEIVLIEGKKPSLTFRSAPTVSDGPKAERMSGRSVDLIPKLGDPVALEECELNLARGPKSYRWTAKGTAHADCRWLIPFSVDGHLVDILSFRSLSLKGTASGAFSIVLVDRIGAQLGGGVEILESRGPFDVKVDLAAVVPSIDLRHVAGLLVVTGSSNWSLSFAKAALAAGEPAEIGEIRKGLWLWDTLEAVKDPEATLETCVSVHCTRLAVQIPDLGAEESTWIAYGRLMTSAQKKGIEALALDGYPEAILKPEPLVERIQKVLTLAGGAVAGIQLDVEPYLLKGPAAEPEVVDRKYVELMSRMAALTGERTSLSAVMPFWYTQRRVDGKSVGLSVMSMVDDVVVMSYRTGREEFLDISSDWIRYSKLTGVPLWLAVETQPLPVEEHIVLNAETETSAAQAYLDEEERSLVLKPPDADNVRRYRIRERYTVRPERLTFAGSSKQSLNTFISVLSADSVIHGTAGIMIHDWTGYWQLPD